MRIIETGTDELLCSVTNHVATITLNNPAKRNAMGDKIGPALRQMLIETETDPDVRVLVLTGAGTAFCAGGDISSMGDRLAGGGAPDRDAMIERLNESQQAISLKLYNFPKPTIAALPGAAAGAGMSLALACDLRIAATSAALVPAFGMIGLSGDFGGSWYLTHLIGPGRAKEIYFTGRRVLADEGHALGIFNHVVADDELAQTTATMAAKLAAGPPIALSYMKANHNHAAVSDLASTLQIEAGHMIRSMLTVDHKQAAFAFMTKQKPEFSGR
ncbi:MAG: 2-(1,2-epoxy-1,2-dihydrophenyl)acetyl-CoA isomerase [Paracoccaceae bacterium]|jgi:2-(1,2-epoxy-1,2-dihydrophenyl)acetyl-CoA isomerase